MAFNPEQHLRKIQGRDYLEVKWRLVWLRTDQPNALLTTSLQEHDPERRYALFKAEVVIPNGGSATGWGSETGSDFGEYLEKAETKAIGRALGALGFGTQFTGPDFDDDGQRVVDSPVERPQSRDAGLRKPGGNPPERPDTMNSVGEVPTVAQDWCLAMDSAGTLRELNETVRLIPKGLPSVDAAAIKASYEKNKARLA